MKNKIHFKIDPKYYIWIVFILAAATRLAAVFVLEPYMTQISDFGKAFEVSQTMDFSTDYYKVFYHWILLPSILNVIYKVFGASQLVALCFNAVILIASSVLVYKIGCLLYKNRNLGFLGALVYIFWPANILYTLILTPEHICVLLLFTVMYLFLWIENKDFDRYGIKSAAAHAVIGILLALGAFFKNFSPVFLIGFLIYFVMVCLQTKPPKQYYISKLITMVVIIISFVVAQNATFAVVDHLTDAHVARNITPCYLNVGLRGSGTYSAENYNMYFSALEENNFDYKETNKQILDKLFTQKEANLSLSFFNNKANIAFGKNDAGMEDYARMDWMKDSVDAGEHYRLGTFFGTIVQRCNSYYFQIIVFLMAIGLIVMYQKRDLKIFLLYLILFGSLLLLLLVEAQNRYMYAVQPIICILSARGIQWLYNSCKQKSIEVKSES
ncbi:MAG: hypothetical protein HFE66_02910 [Clostridiales bacterium]|nr:hypothetical protein [Clostridiales bacterium]